MRQFTRHIFTFVVVSSPTRFRHILLWKSRVAIYLLPEYLMESEMTTSLLCWYVLLGSSHHKTVVCKMQYHHINIHFQTNKTRKGAKSTTTQRKEA